MNKNCPKCKRVLPFGMFYSSKRTKDGFRHWCKECDKIAGKKTYTNNKERYLRNAKEYRARNPEMAAISDRRAQIKRRYGLTIEEFNSMMDEQGGVCAIPACPNEAKVIDHCHSTGKVRGLLCHSCNLALGFVKDDPRIITGLAWYVQRSR